MKLVKILVIALIAYAGLVAAFESMIGIMQPTVGDVLVITTTNDDDVSSDRVLARLETDGKIYVAANHWPRKWYKQALANPDVRVTIEGETGDYVAVPVDDAEHERLQADHATGLGFRFMTGFPPRHFLRLDPKPAAS
jgi:hypothetical protein